LFLAKSGDLSQFQLSVVGHLNGSTTAFSSVHGLAASLTHPGASDHAPPLASGIPLYQQSSVLRI
jgi:hypothetical protein